jgi:hypothetical protein
VVLQLDRPAGRGQVDERDRLLTGLGMRGPVLGGLLFLCRRDQKTHDLIRDNTGTVTTGQIAMGYGAECHAAPDSAVGIAHGPLITPAVRTVPRCTFSF